MTDKELANAIVALGVGERLPTKSEFVRDWRVAGAMMEKCLANGIHVIVERGGIIVAVRITPNGETISTGELIDKSLSRAINEACAKALAKELLDG